MDEGHKLMRKYAEQEPSTIVKNNKTTNSCSFADKFLKDLNENLNTLFKGNPEFTREEIKQRSFLNEIKLEYLDIL